MSVRVEVRGLDLATGAITGRLQDLRPATARCQVRWLQSVGAEFDQEVYFRSRGGVFSWPKTKNFGSRKAPRKTLQPTRRLRNAVTGRGPGAIKRFDRESFTIGVRGSVIPHAEYLRGGTGHSIRFRPRVIRPKKRVRGRRSGPQQFAMWWALFHEYGVTLSMRKLREGLRLPVRPWGGISRRLRREWDAIISSYIRSGRQRTAA